MNRVLSGTEPAAEVLESVKSLIKKLGTMQASPASSKSPSDFRTGNCKLVIVQVGQDPASDVYVRTKLKKAESVGMIAELKKLPETAKEKELLSLVLKLNKDDSVDGFIVQLPLPKHINTDKIIEAIDPEKDADGLTPLNIGKLATGTPETDFLLPATPSGIIRMLEYHEIQVKGKHAVVIGRSNIVGKPIALMLLNRDATVTLCHSKTQNLKSHTLAADIIISAVGTPGLITADMVKEGAIVIDAGTTKTKESTVGDVDFGNVIKKADCSPVPGGVGPMTVAMLLFNVVKAAERRKRLPADD